MDSKRLLERFMRYVYCDSESGSERNFCELMESELSALGFDVIRDEVGELAGSNGFNVYGYLPGVGEPILFSAHMDTVSPGVGIKPVIDNGVIRSGGDTILGSDDKSGIAPVLEAVESILESGKTHRPIEVLFSVCEELGLKGAKYANYSLIKSKQAVVLDSGMKGSAINRAPKNIHLYITIIGKSAHAAVAPESGIHAIKAASAAVLKIECGTVDDVTVMNIANFLSPGKTNIIPGKATFDIEIRSFINERLEEHVNRVEAALKEACSEFGATYEIKREDLFEALHVPESSPLLKQLTAVYKDLGIDLKVESTFGGSDATWIFSHGIDALNIGTGMADVHSLTEHIAVDDLELTTLAMEQMMLNV